MQRDITPVLPVSVLTLAGRPLPVFGTARMYVCGVTPYDVTHLGHAATFVWADTAARVLRHLGHAVQVCRNVTDVDDVLFEAAGRAGEPYDRLAAVQQFYFDRDMEALRVRRPEHEPRAHNFIPQVIALSQALLSAGAAYQAHGSVYFRGADAVARAGVDPAEAARRLGAAGDPAGEPGKLDALDVAVWRSSSGDQPAWPSPWGPGRPGWHAECAAMSLSTFGPALDLHCGGADLRFPHHVFEAAQAEAVTGVTPFARAWMHVGTVSIDGAKMAKSTGNLVLVKDLLAGSSPAAIRLMLLRRHYGQEWEYTPPAISEAEQQLAELYAAASRPSTTDNADEAARARLADDLDVTGALDIAVSAGGSTARRLIETLALA
ncbi:MAG: cysteine--tRNA ligase [Actinomycetota bacterium]|nr:cysteine--tRNA ligase [Actinomycetota bacterium]